MMLLFIERSHMAQDKGWSYIFLQPKKNCVKGTIYLCVIHLSLFLFAETTLTHTALSILLSIKYIYYMMTSFL
jgi:hypothetical protein